jgi:hypothetical protein
MPREKPPARMLATSPSPASSITSSTRRRPIPAVRARASRLLRADNPGCTDLASSKMPSSDIGAAASG